MSLPIFHVSAFVNGAFTGNPAAICLLKDDRPTEWMQAVANEMNLSETAFVREVEGGHQIRWFTPQVEVDLCGHATLAAAHVLYTTEAVRAADPIQFQSRSGELVVRNRDGGIELNFPATPPRPLDTDEEVRGLFNSPIEFYGASRFDRLVVLPNASLVRELSVDYQQMAQAEARGWIVSARADDVDDCDIVSRFFAPAVGVNEDPVTGSAHCCLAPYWCNRLGQSKLRAVQASPRSGAMEVSLSGERVLLWGKATTTTTGKLLV